jgi:hypothetical protein
MERCADSKPSISLVVQEHNLYSYDSSSMKLLPIVTFAATVSGFTTAAENNHRNNLPFISKTLRSQLSFASGRSSSATGLRDTLKKRGALQKLNLNQDDNDITSSDNNKKMEKKNKKILDTIHVFGANLVLQVFGGAGK